MVIPINNVTSSPLQTDSSNTGAIYKAVEIFRKEEVANCFKVMAYLMNRDNTNGGKPKTQVAPKHKKFARDFIKLLGKHQLENQQAKESLDHE